MASDWAGFFAECQNGGNLKRFLESLGAEKVGKSMFCIFHDNTKTPAASYFVDGKGEHFKCFVCDKRGSIFDLYAEKYGISEKKELYKAVGDFCGVPLPNAQNTRKYAREPHFYKPLTKPAPAVEKPLTERQKALNAKWNEFWKNFDVNRPPASPPALEPTASLQAQNLNYEGGELSVELNTERRALYATTDAFSLESFTLLELNILRKQYANAPIVDFEPNGVLGIVAARRANAALNAWLLKRGLYLSAKACSCTPWRETRPRNFVAEKQAIAEKFDQPFGV